MSALGSGARTQHLGHLVQLDRQTLQLGCRQLVQQQLAGSIAFFSDELGDVAAGVLSRTARIVQLVQKQEENIQFAHRAQPFGHPSQPPDELAGEVGVELQNWQQLAQASGSDARAMEAAYVAMLDAV